MALDRLNILNISETSRNETVGCTFFSPTTAYTHTYFLHAGFDLEVTGIVCQTESGTATVAVNSNGVAITGLSSVNVTSSRLTTDITPVAVPSGNVVKLVISAVGSPVNLTCHLKYRRTS